jgi:hypothetical protein
MPDQTISLNKIEQYKLERVYFGKLIAETIVLILLCLIPLVVVADRILLSEYFSKSFVQLHKVISILTPNQQIGLYILGFAALLLLPFQLKRIWRVQLLPDKLVVKPFVGAPVELALSAIESITYSTSWNIKRYRVACGVDDVYLPYHLENQEEFVNKLRAAIDDRELAGATTSNTSMEPGLNPVKALTITTNFKQEQSSRWLAALIVGAHGVFVIALWCFFFSSLISKQVATNDLGLIGLVAGILTFAFCRRLELLLKVPFEVTVLPGAPDQDGGLEIKTLVGSRTLSWPQIQKMEDFVFLLPKGINLVTAKGKQPLADNLDGFDELRLLLKQKIEALHNVETLKD